MNPIFKTYRPEGFSTLNAYIFSPSPEALIDFYKNAFYAEEIDRTLDEETKEIRNSIMKIGDSCFMISQAKGQFLGMRTSFYLYVDDVDVMFENALKFGSEIVFPPADMDYQDRQGGVIDPGGNYWWISKRLVEKEY